MNNSAATNQQAPGGATPHALPRLGVVLVAAGRGERLGAAMPKAFVELGGRSLIEFGIRTIVALPHPGNLAVVVPEERAVQALGLVDELVHETSSWRVTVVHGGRERHESVRFGIEALPKSVDTVLVHDAARPLASAELFERVITEVHHSGTAVVPGLPVADTLKRVNNEGIVSETVDRSVLVAVQTPQGFPREVLEAAHATLQLQSGATKAPLPSDDAEVVQRSGGMVRTVLGEARAHKVTTPDDLRILTAFLDSSRDPAPTHDSSTTASTAPESKR